MSPGWGANRDDRQPSEPEPAPEREEELDTVRRSITLQGFVWRNQEASSILKK